MKKKWCKKKICLKAETGWATAHLSHDTVELYRDTAVMGAQGKATIRPGHTHNTSWQGHDTASLCAGHAAARACGLAKGRVTIQTLYHGLGGGGGGGGGGELLYRNIAATRPRCATIQRFRLRHGARTWPWCWVCRDTT